HPHGQPARPAARSGFRNAVPRSSAEPVPDGGDQEEGEAADGAADDAGRREQDAPSAIAQLYLTIVLAAPDADRTVIALAWIGEIARSLPPRQASARDCEQDQQR